MGHIVLGDVVHNPSQQTKSSAVPSLVTALSLLVGGTGLGVGGAALYGLLDKKQPDTETIEKVINRDSVEEIEIMQPIIREPDGN